MIGIFLIIFLFFLILFIVFKPENLNNILSKISKKIYNRGVWFAKKIKYFRQRISKEDSLPLVSRAYGKDEVYKELAGDLDSAFHSSDIRNIGIEGDMAVGKSSFIKTYEKRKTLPFFRYLNISAVNCGVDSAKNKLTQEMFEAHFLKQILSYAHEGELTDSKYRLVSGGKRKRFCLAIGSFAVLISAQVTRVLFEQWKIFIPEANREYVQGGLAIVICCSTFTSVLSVLSVLRKYASQIKLNKINVEIPHVKTEIDIALKNGIEENADELKSALEQMKRKISYTVVFEDLELISPDECLDIFRKLKNLNLQVNNNLLRCRFYDLRFLGKRPIRFIYCYRNVFGDQLVEDKFFDKVIHIPPRLSIDNIGNIIEGKINEEIRKGRYGKMPQTEGGLRFEEEYMSKVGKKFLDNYRNLNRFVSRYLREWSIFVTGLGDTEPLEDDPKRLFSFILYQEIWPSSINIFQSRNFSELARCLENNFPEINDSADKELLLYLSEQCPESYRVNEFCMRFIGFDPLLYEKHCSVYKQAKEAENYELAITCISKAICCEPENRELYLERAICYEKLGNTDMAIAERAKAESM